MTSREFADLIGVSQSTVSRSLNGSAGVSGEMRRYVMQMAEKHGFVLNSQAQSLKTKRTGTIGVIFPLNYESLSKNLMFTHIYEQLQLELSRRDYDTMGVYDYLEGERGFERIVRSGKVDGLIDFRSQRLERELELIQKYRIPFVTLQNAANTDRDLHQLIIDKQDAGRQVGEHFGRCDGVDRVMYISVRHDPHSPAPRLIGYRKGLASFGKSLREEDILSVDDMSMELAHEEILRHESLFRRERIALYVYNDLMAAGVLSALSLLGIRVPEQVQLISMDDIPLASWVRPRLSTVRSPIGQMISDGCSLLSRLIDGEEVPPRTRVYQPELVLRETTR